MRVHAIDAAEGDCLLLEDGGRFALVDGGIAGICAKRLMPYLMDLPGGRKMLEAVIVSHVDADHITGILDLFAEVERARADGEADPVAIADLWHNGFGSTIDDARGSLFANIQAMVSQAGRAGVAAANGSIAMLGIAEGAKLQRMATKLGIPLNGFFGGGPIVVEGATRPAWPFGNASFAIVGPTRENLDELRREWVAWIERHVDGFEMGDVTAMANADTSVPNLSSIVLFGETADGDVLLTGDARGDHILQGLERTGFLAADGTRQLRLLKVQHHGSDRNATREFFERLPADIYLVSANGRHDNPDTALLAMIVDAAEAAGRHPHVVVTNEAPSLDWLRQNRPPAQHGYTLSVRKESGHAVVIDLATGAVA
ncbi:MBL fold metallo-hydrolase [Amaricoccus sp.]|uniref:MBL fold metallo-hydrolase n=1 Tax=Amaricoccus sp. TaxID=1872485 RepID=UPI002C9BA832|nr:MBL fold metallo-hydrolase [Amaricoccus sp.]HMR60826.1 MBL fold metallo-hydrolase [Amaricoccus sp.]